VTRRKRIPSEVRRQAQARLDAGGPAPPPPDTADALRLLHELQVHQVELELQNEELQRARGELELALRRYTELFDFAPIGYARLSADGMIREVNHAGAHLLGRERARLVDTPFGRIMNGDALADLAALLARAREGEPNASCELRLAAAGGGSAHLRLTATALSRGEPQILLAFEDITERKEKELQLVRTEQALREAARRKDEFLAMLSHELRNPLAPMRNSLFVLDHAPPGSEDALEAHAILDRQVTHLTRLVGDLLDVTRITSGKIELQLERVELGELVRRTMDDHRAMFQASGIRLEARFEPGAYWIEGDPTRLVQIVSNVLGNAEKFTPPGGEVEVILRHLPEDRIVLCVRDTGIGIAADVIGQLFQPFAQAPQPLDRGRGGLGLGLATLKGLRRGTELAIELPAAPATGAKAS
jgi:PAS domain S-box-containing protein